jgi:hypothetical protein
MGVSSSCEQRFGGIGLGCSSIIMTVLCCSHKECIPLDGDDAGMIIVTPTIVCCTLIIIHLVPLLCNLVLYKLMVYSSYNNLRIKRGS